MHWDLTSVSMMPHRPGCFSKGPACVTQGRVGRVQANLRPNCPAPCLAVCGEGKCLHQPQGQAGPEGLSSPQPHQAGPSSHHLSYSHGQSPQEKVLGSWQAQGPAGQGKGTDWTISSKQR
ncbi:hypothetical protein H1C71_032488 [Ictidomys tridecemlineatus]|nr:hypothetical protein H1C71_032488 [Ictidomys tridecemlineatus]